MKKYDPQKIEKKWQKYWEAKGFYNTKKGKNNFMLLTEFPYTSGNLHMGHWYAYSPPDILGRYLRMNGYNVLYPIGFDAFGLPAENAAIQRNINPSDWTEDNIKQMTKQLKSIGAAFDWSREVKTNDPEYYKWTQWIFLKLYEKGLAYRAKTLVNWCPKDKTVLANEQVVGGRCFRDDELVVQKEIEQWMFKITDYAGRLIDDLEGLDWPEVTKIAQKNWVGRSEGAIIKFSIFNFQFSIDVFTTRSDTLFGATYLVLAPEHEIINRLKDRIVNWSEVKSYIEAAVHKTELTRKEEAREKTGVELKGVKATNPATKEEIPVWIADYVLGGYGTGAIMAVPAHDQRDFEFAKKFGLKIKNVIEPVYTQTTEPGKVVEGLPFDERDSIIAIVKHWSEEKYLGLKWKKVAWGTFITGGIEKSQTPEEAGKMEIREETGYLTPKLVKEFGMVHGKFYHVPKKTNRFAHARVLYFELQDESQEEIPKSEQEIHEIKWLNIEELKKFLTPDAHQYSLRMLIDTQGAYTGEGILTNSGKFDGVTSEKAKWEINKFVGGEKKTQYRLRDWVLSRQRYWGVPIPMTYCENCGYQPVSEKDLPVELPKLKDFKPSEDGRSPLAKAEKWVKTKCPKCEEKAERETDTMDTFVDSSWYFIRYTDPKNKKEFANPDKIKEWLPAPLYIGGADHNTMHLLYSRFLTKVLYDLGHLPFSEPFLRRINRGWVLGPDHQKMSKSKGNVIDPDAEVEKYGADAVRMYLAFMGPFEQGGSWDLKGINGVYRFLNRVWNFVNKPEEPKIVDQEAEKIINKAVKEIGDDIKELKFNTGVSGLMKLLNAIEDKWLTRQQHETFLKLLAPFAPHLAEEIWMEVLGNKKSIHLESGPEYDEKYLQEETIDLVIQINGRTRDVLKMARDLEEEKVKEMALALEKVNKYLEGKEVKKVIFISNRLINLIV